jgi:hypothetical protein
MPEVLSSAWTGEYDVTSILAPGIDDQTDASTTGLVNYFFETKSSYAKRPTFIRLSEDVDRNNYILTMPPVGRFIVFNVAVSASLGRNAAVASPSASVVSASPSLSAITATATVEAPTELARIVADVRQKVDLPVADIAKICGVGRRQFYNLLQGSTKTATDEGRIRRVHSYLSAIYELLGHDPGRVRSAVLMPLQKQEYLSFFDVAALGNDSKTRAAFEDLQQAIGSGLPLHQSVPPSLQASPEVAEHSLRVISERARLGTDDID